MHVCVCVCVCVFMCMCMWECVLVFGGWMCGRVHEVYVYVQQNKLFNISFLRGHLYSPHEFVLNYEIPKDYLKLKYAKHPPENDC